MTWLFLKQFDEFGWSDAGLLEDIFREGIKHFENFT